MGSIYTELALCGSKNECARTDTVFLQLSGVSEGMVSLYPMCLDLWSLRASNVALSDIQVLIHPKCWDILSLRASNNALSDIDILIYPKCWYILSLRTSNVALSDIQVLIYLKCWNILSLRASKTLTYEENQPTLLQTSGIYTKSHAKGFRKFSIMQMPTLLNSPLYKCFPFFYHTCKKQFFV